KEDPRDKSMAFEKGANDYLVKLPDKIELVARIRAHSRTYQLQMQRDEAYRELEKLQERLEESNRKLEERNAILQRLSVLDGLTGIANRRHFDEILKQEWKRGHRDASSLAIIMIDIDFFKKFNDNYGHQGGDDCLKRAASALSDTLHRPGDFIARYGGEEFVVLLPNTDAGGGAIIAEQMRSNIEAQNIDHALSSVSTHVTISLGVASVLPDDAATPEDLIAKADGALYKAKAAGRNRCMIHGQ
ncbi:MAG: diguanylate cyclase, partial [Deltaproteobacteria bacterium]